MATEIADAQDDLTNLAAIENRMVANDTREQEDVRPGASRGGTVKTLLTEAPASWDRDADGVGWEEPVPPTRPARRICCGGPWR